MKRLALICCTLSLTACAARPTPVEVAALQAAKETAQRNFARFPGLKTSIAASVKPATFRTPPLLSAHTIESSEISELKFYSPYGDNTAISMRPFYCVRVHFAQDVFNPFGAPTYYQVDVSQIADRSLAMRVTWGERNVSPMCTNMKTQYQPFPELR